MPVPYRIIDNDYSVDVVGHDDKFIQLNIGNGKEETEVCWKRFYFV
ncbi:MAG: hypothetical protein ACE5GG_03585 [Candidatus Omnitrophota bacterium]